MGKTIAKVTISKGNLKKEIPKAQWDAMAANKATYGWSLASNLTEDVLTKEKQIQTSKESELKAANNELSGIVKKLSIELSVKEDQIQELKARLASSQSPDSPGPKENGQELTPETSTRAQLDEIAASKGIDPSKLKTKADVIAAING